MFTYLTNGERSLFDEFDRLQREVDQLFGAWPQTGLRGGRAGAFPAVNIGATPEAVHVYAFAPGFEAKDFEVAIQQNVLTIGGTRKAEARENCTWYLRERFTGDFRRVITLPEDVDPDKVAATYRDGVLHLVIERRAAVRARQITVG